MSSKTDTAMGLAGKKIWVAGHRGMVGSAVVRRLAREDSEVITASRGEVNLLSQKNVESFFEKMKPDIVVLAAAKVGGILANNDYPADFLYENLAIQTNVVESSFRHGVKKLLILGSSCIYPKLAPQPIVESALLTGPLEATNEWYAIAKIAGIKLGQAYRRQHGCDFISAMPTNLYGIGDNFDLTSSHVLPALIRKAHDAKRNGARAMVIWGTGTVRREFLHADDCADALVHLLANYSDEEHVNVGFGDDITIADLAQLIAGIVGFEGTFEYDRSKPDGTPRKLMDSGKLRAMGWQPSISLKAGIEQTYRWFLNNVAS
jgi:GDP-L-fucose synthase